MKSQGLDLPMFTNPCDFFMKELKSDDNLINFDNFINSKANQDYQDNMNSKKWLNMKLEKRKVNNSYCYELKILSQRTLNNNLKNPKLYYGRIYGTCNIYSI